MELDFSGLGQAIGDALVKGLQALASPLPFEAVAWLLAAIQGILAAQGPLNLLTQIPLEWTTGSHEVVALHRLMLIPNMGVTALVLAIQGWRVTSGRADLWEVMIRTGFCLIAGQSVMFWGEKVFAVFNQMSSAILTTDLDLASRQMPNDLVLALMLVIGAILAALAWVKGAVGVVFIMVLLVSAPFLFSLSSLPLLGGLGTWWAEEMTTWVLRPFMVALVLRLGLGLGTNFEGGGGLYFLFAIIAFWLAWTMDSRIRRFSVGAWGGAGSLNIFSRGARMAAGAFSGGATAPAAAAASAATP